MNDYFKTVFNDRGTCVFLQKKNMFHFNCSIYRYTQITNNLTMSCRVPLRRYLLHLNYLFTGLNNESHIKYCSLACQCESVEIYKIFIVTYKQVINFEKKNAKFNLQ